MDPDLPVMLALQAGDDSALNELIARHREALHRFVFRYVQDETVAADIVQESFVRVYFKARKYEPRSTVKTWIFTIAVNLCHDQFRRFAKRRGEISLEWEARGEGTRGRPDPVDPNPGPAARAAQDDQFAALRRAIDELPHGLKAALVLFTLEGHSQKEAAEILGTTPKTVELRVYRAKEKLRQILGTLFLKES